MRKLAYVVLDAGRHEGLAVIESSFQRQVDCGSMLNDLIHCLNDEGHAGYLMEALTTFSGMNSAPSLDSCSSHGDNHALLFLETGYVLVVNVEDMPQSGNLAVRIDLVEGEAKLESGENYDIPEDWETDIATTLCDEGEDYVLAINLLAV